MTVWWMLNGNVCFKKGHAHMPPNPLARKVRYIDVRRWIVRRLGNRKQLRKSYNQRNIKSVSSKMESKRCTNSIWHINRGCRRRPILIQTYMVVLVDIDYDWMGWRSYYCIKYEIFFRESVVGPSIELKRARKTVPQKVWSLRMLGRQGHIAKSSLIENAVSEVRCYQDQQLYLVC